MSTIFKNEVLVSPEEYLRTEPDSFEKREYIEGVVYNLTNFTVRHNIVSGNVLAGLHNCLRGKKGEVFGSQTKVRLQMPNSKLRFYYPDVQIVYESNPYDDVYQDKPVLVAEVTLPMTWRTDHVEKFAAYMTIPTLEWYLLVDSASCEVYVHQKQIDGIKTIKLTSLEDILKLESLGIELPLTNIYDRVQFTIPAEDSDEDE